ncbi:MAG TPA: hypothetical protein VH816_05785 [Gaiellaceae bacterium]|jgi:hypothetical protein
MTLRQLGILQWLGLLLGAGVWVAQHLIGSGLTQADCGAGGAGWGISNDAWQAALALAAAALVLSAEAAAITVFARTRGAGFGDGPPSDEGELRRTRLHFFAAASIAANAIFFLIIVLDGVASIVATGCRQG